METTEIRFSKLLRKYNFSEEDAGEFIALHKEMLSQDLATKADLAEVKSALTWRMFVFWLAQIGAFIAFAYKIFPGM